ncbi:MAG: 3-dehydroquinate synthase [Anaerolineae bacterium]
MADSRRNIILTGFMGTGKSTVAQYVAQRLGMSFVDMDQVIAQRAGMTIAELFRLRGEAAFRQQEKALGAELSLQSGLVIATGGGALLDQQLRQTMAASGLIICLDATLQALKQRLQSAVDRPLLQGDDRGKRMMDLWRQRRPIYAQISHHIDTTNLALPQVVEKVLALAQADPHVFHVNTPQGAYQVLVQPAASDSLGDLLLAHDLSQRILVVSDEQVWPLYGSAILQQVSKKGFVPTTAIVPAGERFKTLDTVRFLYDRCVDAGLDRHSVILALGGGVVTDMAGFVAATFLRGIPYIPIPSSLLGMVDASVGGKVAIDHPRGKNLIGAFNQPLLVLVDPSLLATLPSQELNCGLAEIIKAGIIGDAELFLALEEGTALPPWRWLIERALAVKIAIVEEDPYETGRRAVLNLGHTFAHAFEVLADYTLPHGLAVSIGIAASTELAVIRGQVDIATRDRIISLLRRHHLPTTCAAYPVSNVIDAMRQDKKRSNSRLRFIVPRGIGDVVVDDTVTEEEIVHALERIRG